MPEERIEAGKDLERPDERDREAWNLPGPPLVPVGPPASVWPSRETPENADDEEDGGA